MKLVPITIAGCDSDLSISSIRLSEKIRWQRMVHDDDPENGAYLMHLCIVDKEGNRIKSKEEWDGWAGENDQEAERVYLECIGHITPSKALEKK